jgi:uncharacterized protein (TIGR03000 family)
MNRPLLFCVLTFFAVVGVTLTGGQKQASGGHGCHGCHGYYNNCSGCYGCDGALNCSGCDGCDGCWGRPVVVRRAILCSGCHGCHGCSGCQGSSACYGCWGEATEVPTESAVPPPAAPAAETQTRLSVEVPADAVVIINDHTTTSTGNDRSYVSRGLEAGGSYRYEVRAEITRNGETVSQTKVVNLMANETANLTFNLNPPQVASVIDR